MSEENTIAVTNKNKVLTAVFAEKHGVPQGEVLDVIAATVFRKESPSKADVMAFMVVANEHGLNPFTGEIYAFKGRSGGIIPIVSVDGWARLINQHPEFSGMEIKYSDDMIEAGGSHKKAHDWIEVKILRKDREQSPVIREYFEEVYKNTDPWNSHTKRMHRHKAIIQAARVTFGYAGVYDKDEAERIQESQEKQENNGDAEALTERFSDDAIDAEFTESGEPKNETNNQDGNQGQEIH